MKSPSDESTLQVVVLDTCVIQHAGSSEVSKAKALSDCLENLSSEHNLVISQFSVFENLYGLWGKNADLAAQALDNFEQKPVTKDVLIMSAVYGGLCGKMDLGKPSQGDTIIGATAILENGLILTENRKDFPAPLFESVKWIPVVYKTHGGRYEKTLDLHLCVPNLALLSKNVKELDASK